MAGVSENRRTSRWWNLQDPFTRAAIDLSIPANAKAAPSGLVADDGLPGSRADAEHRQDEPPSRHPQGLTILPAVRHGHHGCPKAQARHPGRAMAARSNVKTSTQFFAMPEIHRGAVAAS